MPRSAPAARMASGFLIHMRMRWAAPVQRREARDGAHRRREVKGKAGAMTRAFACAPAAPCEIVFDARNFGPYGGSPQKVARSLSRAIKLMCGRDSNARCNDGGVGRGDHVRRTGPR